MHQGHTYTFGGLKIRLLREKRLSEEELDYMTLLLMMPTNMMNTNGHDTLNRPDLTLDA